MRIGVLLIIAAATAACSERVYAPAQDSGAQHGDAGGAPVNMTRVIVVIAPGGDAGAVVRRHGLAARRTFERAVNGFAADLPPQAVNALLRDPQVVRVDYDGFAYTTGEPAGMNQSNPTWGLDRVDQRALPLDKQFWYAFAGSGVKAYIFDTGLRFDHAEFEGRAVSGFDAFGGNGGDCHGHGTHVGGTVGGRTVGVAKSIQLISVRVADCSGTARWSDVIAGIDWVISTNSGPAVANMSLGGTLSESLNSAVRKLIAAGVHVSLSAGNSDADACDRSPSSTAEAITVGGTTTSDSRRSSSNWGPCVDLFAPGSSIVSAAHSSTSGTTSMSGTSMAAPHVAGVMALFLEEHPSLTPAQMHQLIVDNATQNVITSAKSTNAHLVHSVREVALPLALAEPSSPPPAPSSLTARVSTLSSVDVRWIDGSANEAGFAVERRHGSGAWIELVRIGANTVSYTDRSVLQREQYTYRVRAFNSGGASAATNEASVTVNCATKGNSTNCK